MAGIPGREKRETKRTGETRPRSTKKQQFDLRLPRSDFVACHVCDGWLLSNLATAVFPIISPWGQCPTLVVRGGVGSLRP